MLNCVCWVMLARVDVWWHIVLGCFGFSGDLCCFRFVCCGLGALVGWLSFLVGIICFLVGFWFG